MHWADLWRDFLRGDPSAVEALSTWATVVVAIIAAGFVWWQIRQASHASREQAEPNVVAVMQSNPNQPEVVEIAIKNYGQTPARDVRFVVDPRPQRVSMDGTASDVWLPELIPYLAPGEEWRTIWDSAPRRYKSTLTFPVRHTVTITYRGLARKPRTSSALFDWTPHEGRIYLDQKSIHHGAKALNDIEQMLRGLLDGGRHLRVTVRDGEARDQAEREWFAGRAADGFPRGAWRTQTGRGRRSRAERYR